MNLQVINGFLGNTIKFLVALRNSIDYYEIDSQSDFDFDNDEEEIKCNFVDTLVLAGMVIFSIVFTAITAILNIIMFVVNTFIAPYVGKVALYTLKILAFITAIIFTYWLLVKFNQVNTFVDKQYIDFFIKGFQNICKGVN